MDIPKFTAISTSTKVVGRGKIIIKTAKISIALNIISCLPATFSNQRAIKGIANTPHLNLSGIGAVFGKVEAIDVHHNHGDKEHLSSIARRW